MIIGDSASGKSTFALKLGDRLSIPVFHIDKINEKFGRENTLEIQKEILTLIEKPNWIFDGNGLTKDKNERIKKCDVLIVFDCNPLITLFKQIVRHLKIRLGKEKRIGSDHTKLNLRYFIPYIFLDFPERKRTAIATAKNLGKKVFIFRIRKRANDFLTNLNQNL